MLKRSGPGARAIAHTARSDDLADQEAPNTAPTPIAQAPAKSWRDFLHGVHEAAELFPRMPPDELRRLGEDIKKNGLRVPIVLMRWGPSGRWRLLVDGRNRLDAMELVGLEVIRDGKLNHALVPISILDDGINPFEFVISANIHRRHLTAEQKRDLIAKLLKANPEKSNRQSPTWRRTITRKSAASELI
jgi:hypothetical protein